MALVAAHPAHGFAHWKAVVFAAVKVFFDPDTSPRCAATAFFGFLSFFPAIATVALIYGIIANEPLVADTVKSLGYVLPPMALTLLDEQLKMLATAPRITLGLGLLISVPLALWSGSRGVEALLFAMSRVRGAPERRGFIKELLVAVGMTIGGSLFVAVALATVAGLPALIPFPTGADWILLLVRWPVLLVISIVVMALLYRFGPDRHPHKFRFIWPGAVLASLLWLLAGAIFSIYVQNWGHYSATFGSVSAAVVLLLWMYNSAQILVLGAAFNAALEHEAGEGPASGVVTSDYAEALPPR
ncbi:MAG TPA: YihY/virulence factor BrkB family protein [Devosia sp.]|jgi:membrane protein|nr:YihY/virulence factor BrkB family protein [Devosia sp.]